MPDDATIKLLVFRALNNAVENGFGEMLAWLPREIADDLCEYDAELESVPPEALEPHVRAWLSSKGVRDYA